MPFFVTIQTAAATLVSTTLPTPPPRGEHFAEGAHQQPAAGVLVGDGQLARGRQGMAVQAPNPVC